jgi:glycosyltransferase involved in cell wall biosynthesis
MPEALRGARVAIVHDYLNQAGGAENVVDVFSDMFPGAPIYTSVYDPRAMPDHWRTRDIRTTFLQSVSPRLGVAKKLVPLYPTAFESLDLREFDLVLSSTTAFAKAVITRTETCHVCYCNNPTRFLWMYHDYVAYERLPRGARALLPWLFSPLRVWDFAAAQRVDHFVAGSQNASRRIAKFYRRESDVVQAPIDSSRFSPSAEVEDYFLVVSRLQAYKRIDLAIQACNQLRLPLRIAGAGSDEARLRSMAGPTIRILGRVDDDVRRELFARCRALIFPGEEDFGLTPLEAMASGRPVVAYRAGGALETVKEPVTGVFFNEPTPESLAGALTSLPDTFDPTAIRKHALTFDKTEFRRRMYAVLAWRYAEHCERFRAS